MMSFIYTAVLVCCSYFGSLFLLRRKVSKVDIGSKIKNARIEAKLTQEDVAESLGVSRQTISNLENEKTYPDIISVIKMSDLYDISLDRLLKEEKPMSNYLNYLEDSTNVVKSKSKLAKMILMMSYFVIWATAIIAFWFFTGEDDAMGYSIMFMWVVLPVTTFVISILIGRNDYWGKRKWLAVIAFGLMYMLAEYATFSTANMVSFGKINVPEFMMILYGAIISFVGLFIGTATNQKLKTKKKAVHGKNM